MTINNIEAFLNGLWDWGILDGCFGGRIKPTDIDGMVERNGLFLVLEAKSPGTHIPTGQALTFEAMRRKGDTTIFIVWGETDNPGEIQIWTRHKIHDKQKCDLALLRLCCKRWYDFANRNRHGR